MSLKISLTTQQLWALLLVWPRLQQQPPPNCTQLATTARVAWASLADSLNRLATKGVLRHWPGPGQQRLWAPGPMSDHLQEEGVLLA